jgi:coenzyme F420-reducing hydrogenase beta subunit
MICGACVASCPINVLNVNVNEEPAIKGPCAACQVCYYSCPRLELPIDEIEYFLFGRTRKPEEESIGPDMALDVPTKELEPHMSHPCKYCIDYVAELADISVGGVGSPDGWTTVIVRSELGWKLFDSTVKAKAIEATPFEQTNPGISFVVRLSNTKKMERNAYYIRRGLREGFLEHRKDDLRIPPIPESK